MVRIPIHLFVAQDLVGQARVDEYLHWQHLNTRQCAMYFRVRVKHICELEFIKYTLTWNKCN